MYQLSRVLEHVIDALDDETFAQHDFIPKGHKPVFHVHLDSRNETYAVFKKILEESWGDVSPVSKEPAMQLFSLHVPDFQIPVVHIGPGKAKSGDLSPVIASEVQLEAMTHPIVPFPSEAMPLKSLLTWHLRLWTDWNHCTVHKTDARTASEGLEFQEEHQLEEHTAFKFHESVIGYRIRKIPMQVYSDIMQAVMFEVGERAEMEHNQNGHNLAVGKRCLTMPAADTT